MTGRSAGAIEVRAVRKAYGERTVLEDVSLDVQPGEIVALLGPNGAGKTTTVEIVEGYRRPDGGTVRVLGRDPARSDRNHRARVGLMLQGGGGIDPRMTAREVVRLHGAFHAEPRDADELLGVVGLRGAPARTRYRRLSGGERQRVALAVALAGRPEVAILDEPTAGLDVEARAMIRGVLDQLRSDGVAILLTSHDLADVERVADRIAILDRGRIVASGAPAELDTASATGLRIRLAEPLSDDDRRALEVAIGGSAIPDGSPDRLRLTGVDADPRVIAAVAAWCAGRGIRIVELRTGGGGLEERYLAITRVVAGGVLASVDD